jgi:hypothetical protein
MQTKSIQAVMIGFIAFLILVIGVLGVRVYKQQQFKQALIDQNNPLITDETLETDELIEETTESSESEENETSLTQIDLYAAFVNVHLEHDSISTVKTLWEDLENLVTLADEYDVKLTLHFSVGWAEYAIANEEILTQVRSWESNGHELGMHHHGLSHGTWDGYSNNEIAKKRPTYVGTMDELAEIMNQLPTSGQMLSSSMTDEETDWVEGFLYQTVNEGSGTSPTADDMISTPETITLNGQETTNIGKMGYAIDHLEVQLTLKDIQSKIENAETGQILGIVFNDDTLKNHLDEAEGLFQLFQELEINVMTASNILETYTY